MHISIQPGYRSSCFMAFHFYKTKASAFSTEHVGYEANRTDCSIICEQIRNNLFRGVRG